MSSEPMRGVKRTEGHLAFGWPRVLEAYIWEKTLSCMNLLVDFLHCYTHKQHIHVKDTHTSHTIHIYFSYTHIYLTHMYLIPHRNTHSLIPHIHTPPSIPQRYTHTSHTTQIYFFHVHIPFPQKYTSNT